ncbi:substrate-binding periplasmic protein [Roseateles cavernae]|uniref:substrate-binding periplasmic protein n=1 Tax=Roseateles cavernae TaxID=3153578 RepID=UPI0032E40D5C
MAAEPLRLLSEEFPPINFTQDGQPQGLSVDIVREIQKRLGQDHAIDFMPWVRAFRAVQEAQEPTALFAMARTAEREQQFQWVGPIVVFYSALYAPNGGGLRLKSLDDARRAKAVLVVRGWYTAEELGGLGFRNLVTVNDPAQGIRMLLARRAPLFATERISMPKIMAKAGVAPDALEIVYSYASSEGFIAFSRNTDATLVAAWQAKLDEMKRDGSFAVIYRRWLPNDSPPVATP